MDLSFTGTWQRSSVLLRKEDGQDMVEYALLLGFIAVAALAIIVLVGPYVSGLFSYIVQVLGHA